MASTDEIKLILSCDKHPPKNIPGLDIGNGSCNVVNNSTDISSLCTQIRKLLQTKQHSKSIKYWSNQKAATLGEKSIIPFHLKDGME